MNPDLAWLRSLIRDVPDYPKPGVVFKDITPLLGDGRALRVAVAAMADPFEGAGITHVVGIEARGFIVAAPVAHQLAAGFVPIRKPGKLPSRTTSQSYQLEYGSDTLEMHVDALRPSDRVLIVDDVLATGGTAAATATLVRSSGAAIVGASFLIELGFLAGRVKLTDLTAASVIGY